MLKRELKSAAKVCIQFSCNIISEINDKVIDVNIHWHYLSIFL